MTTPAENKKVVLRYFELLLEGDVDAMRPLFTDDCEFFFAGDLPASGRHDVTTGLAIGAAITSYVTGPVTFNLGTMTAESDRVSVEAESFASTDETSFNNQYHFLFRIRDGKIVQMKEYFDTLLVWEIGQQIFGDLPRSERVSNIDDIARSLQAGARSDLEPQPFPSLSVEELA